jgi:hypothetical protein
MYLIGVMTLIKTILTYGIEYVVWRLLKLAPASTSQVPWQFSASYRTTCCEDYKCQQHFTYVIFVATYKLVVKIEYRTKDRRTFNEGNPVTVAHIRLTYQVVVPQFSAKASVLNIAISNIISPHLAVSNTLVWRLNVRIEHV